MAVAEYLLFALALNLPLGAVRTRTRKFSVAWFVAIHAAIPLVIVARIVVLDISGWWAFAGIAVAVAGQVIGARALAPATWRAIGAAKDAERAAVKRAQAEPAAETAGA